MNTQLTDLIGRFSSLQVLVIGEAMLDSYLNGTADRLCPEAPVPVVAVTERLDAPGGAANTAANVAALGAQVRLLSVIGNDAEGGILRRVLHERGVSSQALPGHTDRRTLAKQRVAANGQILVRFDQGSTGPLDASTEQIVIDRLQQLTPRCDAIIVSDYGYGVLTARVRGMLARLQSRMPRLLVVDAKEPGLYQNAGVTVAKPNYSQAMQLVGLHNGVQHSDRCQVIAAHADEILAQTGARIAAVTLDADGAVVIERGKPPYRTYASPARHAHAAGAGDTFAAAFALALAAGATAPAAADLASAAAAIVVGKPGTTCCTALDLHDRLLAEEKLVVGAERMAALAERYRRQGRRVVFTNGCFDILHRGHISYLNQAKALGDVLIVGMNSDAGVRRLKGFSRPINTLDDRAQVLAAMSCVDHIVPFDEETAVELVRDIKPDIYVKGGDYTKAMLPEAPVVEQAGGTVTILPYVDDRSTSSMIERIRRSEARVGGAPGIVPVPLFADGGAG